MPDYFPLAHPSLRVEHKTIFCLRYFRDVEESAIADHLNLDQSDVQQKLKETFEAISQEIIFDLG